MESQYSLKIFRKLFPEINIDYIDCDPNTGQGVLLPMSTEEAIASLKRAEAFEEDLDTREIGFGFRISLAGMALHTLEKPLEVGAPL